MGVVAVSVTGVITFTTTFTTSVPASKLFDAFILDSPNYIPKAAPQFVKSIEKIEGDGGVGSILQFNFAEAAPVKYEKIKVDKLDKNNLTFADTVIEGGRLSDKIELITDEVKIEPSPNGGCIHKGIVKYHTKVGAEITEEELKPITEGFHTMFKAVETYLLANP